VSGPERVWKREKCAISILWRDRGCVIREGSHPGPVELKQTLDLDLTYRIVSYRVRVRVIAPRAAFARAQQPVACTPGGVNSTLT
jgi:hypothetical protein